MQSVFWGDGDGPFIPPDPQGGQYSEMPDYPSPDGEPNIDAW